jgi:hypothetical protein
MLAVPDTPKAIRRYKTALGAQVLWSLGSVAGLEVDGAIFPASAGKGQFQKSTRNRD